MMVVVLDGSSADTSVAGPRVSNANDLPRTCVFAMPDFRFPDRFSDCRAEAAASFEQTPIRVEGEGI
ncbi:hypothetical protein FVF58_19310 [Paraburkholderia panacisoli]|uniref:Uncharacterized protein n=1 Tax=Paraburkholderia panacisoli TaxID=2603818 RepID=A0A5B0H5J9_9BURK|nr:hypothetical protein [Paraburkholderia panacisoli]KAA1010498.1 hypothetical protein FVF58_19310 [Paraburkholderia panacisoli]